MVTEWWSHNYAQAAAAAERLKSRGWSTVAILSYAGRGDEARRLADELISGPWVPTFDSAFNLVLLAQQKQPARVDTARPALEAIARNPREFSHAHHAQDYLGLANALLGRKREALEWLRMAAAQGFPCYPLFAGDPNLAALHGDPEFDAFMQEMKAQWERLRAEARK